MRSLPAMRSRRQLTSCAIAVALLGAAGFVGIASAAPGPLARYKALLAAPFPVSGLPTGYSTPRVARAAPIYGAVGAVEVRFGGAGKGSVVYTVFRSHSDVRPGMSGWRPARTMLGSGHRLRRG